MTMMQPELPTGAPGRSTSDAALFERIRKLLAACGSNQNDRAVALISACIAEGRNTFPGIMGAAKYVGLGTRHVAWILKRETGDNPKRHWWTLGADGRYREHEEVQPG